MSPKPVSSGQSIPAPVARTAAFLSERHVWYSLGRNHEARSCADAANKRRRLGEEGIPLWDELKSFFGVIRQAGRADQYLIVHCRGDRLIDLDQVGAIVGGVPERLEADDLALIGMEYGLVNPFEPWSLDGQLLASPVLQVFDRDLLRPIGLPGTVMTNAGDLTWSVELYAAELAQALDHVVEADISIHDPEEPERPRWATAPPTIGIITGNGPDSGMLLWRSINQIIRNELGGIARGDVVMPRVLVQSLPEMGLTMELDSRHRYVWPALRTAVAELCRSGASIIAIACNTTPYFAPELRKITAEYGATFVSMPEVVGAWLHEQGIRDLALVGVKTVADLGPWSPYREPLSGLNVEVPDDQTMGQIHDLAYHVKAIGAHPNQFNKLGNIIRRGVRSHVVVLALTEISLVVERAGGKQRSENMLIDTIQLYAAALAGSYLGRHIEPTIAPMTHNKSAS